jgi:hypothetical protein
MDNYNETPESFIGWKTTSFRDAISAPNFGSGTSMASSLVQYANASTQTVINMSLQQKPSTAATITPKSTVLEPKPEPDVFTLIRQPRLPDGPGFARRTRATPKIIKTIFYTDPKTKRALSRWEPGALELSLYKFAEPESSAEDLKATNDRKSWKDEIVYLNQIRQIQRVKKMCNLKASKASSDIERHENIYLDQIKQIRNVRMLCPAEGSNEIERHENLFLDQIKQVRRARMVSPKA